MKLGKKIAAIVLSAAVVATAGAFMAGCGGDSGKEETTRMEAEHATAPGASVESKESDVLSNGFFLQPGGGFAVKEKTCDAKFPFKAAKAGEAKITVAVMSGNTFGNQFDLDDNTWCFYLNDVSLGKPASVVDYMGDETTSCPKEDFTENTGFIYITYNVTLKEGDNTFQWKYDSTKNGPAFKIDYVDITTKCGITWTPNMDLVDNYVPWDGSFGD